MTTRGAEDEPQVRPHDLHVDRHADAHEEQREQQAAERLDVGFELVAVGRFGEQHAGEERAERHRHADDLHQQRGAEHDEQRGRGHHLARAGPGEQAEERIEQIAPGDHQRGDRAADQRDRAAVSARLDVRGVGAAAPSAAPARAAARPTCPGTAGSRRRAGRSPAAGGRGLPGCAARSRWRRARARARRPARRASRTGRSASASPAIAAAVSTSCATPRPKMSRRIASRRDEFEFEPDQEQQHHDAELGDGEDALGRREACRARRGRSPRRRADRRRSPKAARSARSAR